MKIWKFFFVVSIVLFQNQLIFAGKVFREYFPNPDNQVITCICGAHLFLKADVVYYRNYSGGNGKPALLLRSQQGKNVIYDDSKIEDKHLRSGWHTVKPVHCNACLHKIGLKYTNAFDDANKWKIDLILLDSLDGLVEGDFGDLTQEEADQLNGSPSED